MLLGNDFKRFIADVGAFSDTSLVAPTRNLMLNEVSSFVAVI